MSWEHLRSILWLRWRLNVNRWRRAGKLNAILTIAIVMAASVAAVISFFLAVVLGALLLPRAEPDVRLLMFDGLVVAFLIVWLLGLIGELQRDDALSLENLLHFPISLSGAFLLNYLTSLASMSLLLFVPVVSGLIIALVIIDGPSSALLLVPFAAFLLMVTGVTYRFRGWLMMLMVNKRRRNALMGLTVLVVVCIAQLPHLLNFYVLQPSLRSDSQSEEIQALADRLAREEITSQEYLDSFQALQERQRARKAEQMQSMWSVVVNTAGWASAILPIGWFPYGVRSMAQGIIWPAFAGAVASGAIGVHSLWRAYQTTLRFYTSGGQAARPLRPVAAAAVAHKAAAEVPRRVLTVERTLGPLPPRVAAIAWANLIMLFRAPEAKMTIVSPIIMILVFGSMIFSGGSSQLSQWALPFVGLGAVSFPMMGMAQLLNNQFGFDRHGFRVYVLSPARRSEILLGKNISLAPLAAAMSVFTVTLLQIFVPMLPLHYLATLVHAAVTFVLLCLIGNCTSILAPLANKSGSFQSAKPAGVVMLIQFAAMVLSPFAIIPGAVCLAVSLASETFLWPMAGASYLVLSLACLAAVVGVYQVALGWQANLLEQREQMILDKVTAEAD